jgi:hypothetical protein
MIADQVILPNGREVELIRLELRRWGGEFSGSTWGGKPLINVGGKPMFAEIAVLQLMRSQGWDGCWCSSKYLAAMPPSMPITLPEEQDCLLSRIRGVTGSWAGCWDVVLWRRGETRFMELKRRFQDRVSESQVQFLEAALSLGVPLSSFSLVEWELSRN